MVDRRPCLAVTYPAGSPFPWPQVVDELRFLDDDTLLGLTLVNMRGLNRLAFPFLLHHTTTNDSHLPGSLELPGRLNRYLSTRNEHK